MKASINIHREEKPAAAKVRQAGKFHRFDPPAGFPAPPARFTYPFHYTPHPLAVQAAEEVQAYLRSRAEWAEELAQGKMFGVLIVWNPSGELGFLAAFSGILAGKNLHRYFVPPVYDLQQPGGFFSTEEAQISLLNARIRAWQTDPRLEAVWRRSESLRLEARQSLAEAKARMESARLRRMEIRQRRLGRDEYCPGERFSDPLDTHSGDHFGTLSDSRPGSLNGEASEAALIRESQFQKAEFRRLKQGWNDRIAAVQAEITAWENRIEALKAERKRRSSALQQRLFEQFQLWNARGEIRTLCDVFQTAAGKVPPAGAGECAAPKLLQYAYIHGFRPLAMAEFWWGRSPKTEIRRQGYFYPACQGKCGPILQHMLQGLEVDPDPLADCGRLCGVPEILWEDEWLLVVNKPAGMLSVPGKTDSDSVYSWVKARYPEATGPMIVHRLDMATSGVLLIAKTKTAHQHLQAQFKNRTVKKRYVALLDGRVVAEEGIVSLPLCPDPSDRPRQLVHPVYGKPAVTRYRVLACPEEGRTRIAFYPLTGRTHQLRVHASHPDGLNAPIAGDELYGKKADRLYLHAEYLEFRHPVSGETIRMEKKADF